MDLLKNNLSKNRAVYQINNTIRKYWYNGTLSWLDDHVSLLARIIPGYVINHGEDSLGVWMDMKLLPGIPANKEEHTSKFIKFIYDACIKNVNETAPFSHGDWVLSNMLIDGDTVLFCDWDNVGIFDDEIVTDKMNKDLHSAFGDKFFEVIGNDSAGF